MRSDWRALPYWWAIVVCFTILEYIDPSSSFALIFLINYFLLKKNYALPIKRDNVANGDNVVK